MISVFPCPYSNLNKGALFRSSVHMWYKRGDAAAEVRAFAFISAMSGMLGGGHPMEGFGHDSLG